MLTKSPPHHHHHHHNHHHHHRPDHHPMPPLTEAEQKEFDSVGEHVEHLRTMHPHLRRMLYDHMHHITVKAGHLVIMQGEPSDAWYILLRGSLQCVVQTTGASVSVPTSYQFDRNLAEQKNIEKNKEHHLAKNLDEIKDKDHVEQIGEQVSYYFGHGQHITGLVVGVFHPGDSFGGK